MLCNYLCLSLGHHLHIGNTMDGGRIGESTIAIERTTAKFKKGFITF
jgi:hypothetical protein